LNNRRLAALFGFVLVATGLVGLTHAPSPMSSATPYDLFHIAFGAIGIACSVGRRGSKAFNIGFGAIDLYQALAQQLGWFPADWFLWKSADLILHVGIGALLVGLGFSLD